MHTNHRRQSRKRHRAYFSWVSSKACKQGGNREIRRQNRQMLKTCRDYDCILFHKQPWYTKEDHLFWY